MGYGTKEGDTFGMFQIPGRHANGRQLRVMATDGGETGWEHVSVSIEGSKKCPSWEEMCIVKSLFWTKDDCVVQFHPCEDVYVNNHTGCLHMWRCVHQPFPVPPTICV